MRDLQNSAYSVLLFQRVCWDLCAEPRKGVCHVCSGDYEDALLEAGTLEKLNSVLIQVAKDHPNDFEVISTLSLFPALSRVY